MGGRSAVKLLHHDLAAHLVTEEEGSVGGERADHGGREAGVERPHTWARQRHTHTQTNNTYC